MVKKGERVAPMFLGEYFLSFSGQGRVVLPKKFREELKSNTNLVLSRGLDGCVWGFDQSRWEGEAEKQLIVPITDEDARNMRRYLFSGAEIVRLDEQGRFIIPPALLNYAKLKDGVVIIGAGDHFELWNPSSWKKLIDNILYEKVTRTVTKT